MRVLIISAAYVPGPGGVAVHVENLTHSFLKIEECDIYAFVKNYDKNENGEREKFSKYQTDKIKLSIYKYYCDSANNWSGRESPYENIFKFFFDEWDSKIRADIIHAHDIESLYIGYMLKNTYNVPLVYTHHRAPVDWKTGKEKESPKDCFLGFVRKHDLVEKIYVPSRASANILIAQGFKKNKIEIIKHGISAIWMQSWANDQKTSELFPSDAIKILCPLRADVHKDTETFIKAAGLLKKELKEKLFFLQTGESNDIFKLESVAVSCGLQIGKDIIFHPIDFYKKMATVYRKSDICVITSPRESFGQTVLEAFVFRVPVIAANSGALPEIIKSYQNGLLFNVNDPRDLADQIKRLIRNIKLREDIIRNGLNDLKTKYNSIEMANKYFASYLKFVK